MILTDREIEIALRSGQLSITPLPAGDAYSSTSLDLTLAEKGVKWIDLPGEPIRPAAPGYSFRGLSRRQEQIEIKNYSFKPRDFILAWTREKIHIPVTSRLAARVEGKSSIARLGVGIHITAPTIHAGFSGSIQLEMFNLGPYEIVLEQGLRICQLIFEQTLGTPSRGYSGSFFDQTP